MALPLRLPEPGPLLQYISWLSGHDKRLSVNTVAAVKAALSTADGLILLDLLEKSLEKTPLPIADDGRALAARNAQCFIASDLRRILSDETQKLLERQNQVASSGRTVRGRT